MAGAKGTGLATTGAAGEVAAKTKITRSAAIDMVRQLAATKYREDKRASKARRDDLVTRVGSIDRVDDSVIADCERLMTRLALIARKKADRYASSGNAALESIVKKLGAVMGELRAFMLTNASVGLFEAIDEDDYRPNYVNHRDDPLAYAGRKIRDAAETLLERYEIVDDAKPTKNGRGKKSEPEHPSGVCQICGCTEKQRCADHPVEECGDVEWGDEESTVCVNCFCSSCDGAAKTKIYDGEQLCENCAPLDAGEGDD